MGLRIAGQASAYMLDGYTVSAIANNGTVLKNIDYTMSANGLVYSYCRLPEIASGATIQIPDAYYTVAWNMQGAVSCTLHDCVFKTSKTGSVPVYIAGYTNCQGVLVLGGYNKIPGTMSYGGGGSVTAQIQIENDSVIDVTGITLISNLVATASPNKLIIGSNCKIVNTTGATVSINNGNAATCSKLYQTGIIE